MRPTKKVDLSVRICAVLALSLLAACAQGPEKAPLELEIMQVLRDQVALRINAKNKPEPPVLTRALLDATTEPYIEVVVEEGDLRDFVPLQQRRSDDLPGEIEIWQTVDNITFAFRDGMLISTRGLRGGMLSAQAPADGQGPQGPASGGERSYTFRGDDQGSYKVKLACELRNLGAEVLEIVERSYPTQHLQEYCVARDGAVVLNDYWVDDHTARVLKSRQWAGPQIGYLRLRQLVW